MQNRVVRYLGNREDLRTLVKEVINERQNSLCMPFVFSELFETVLVDTVAGTATISVGADAAVVRTVYDLSNKRGLEFVEPEAFDLLDNDVAYADRPTHYSSFSGLLYLYRVPDAVYNLRVRYQRFAAALVGDADVSELPVDWHPIVVKLAAGEIHDINGNTQRAHELKNEALGEISARQEVRTLSRRGKTGTVTIQRRA
jgi:hypothetical protein